jgi:hypothetical protein
MFRPFRALANWGGGVPSAMAYDPGWRFAPRVALRSTLGYLIMPRWGGGMMVHRTRSNCVSPKRGCGITDSLNNARWSYAPTGRKGIAQGKAKRRPGIGVPETTQALKGRNRRRVNQCAFVSPFQGFGELGRRRTQGDGVRPRVALRSTLGYLIKPRWGSGMMIHRARSDGLLPEPDGWE